MLPFEFLAPFSVFAAATMCVATAAVWLRGNYVVATISLGSTLFYAINAVVAFRARARYRAVPSG